eukprot:180952-Amphidinium_carterae.1
MNFRKARPCKAPCKSREPNINPSTMKLDAGFEQPRLSRFSSEVATLSVGPFLMVVVQVLHFTAPLGVGVTFELIDAAGEVIWHEFQWEVVTTSEQFRR